MGEVGGRSCHFTVSIDVDICLTNQREIDSYQHLSVIIFSQ